jgi:hypothetical protein
MALAALLPIGMAALGGIEGYRRSGGDLGAAALGAGIGAAGGRYLPGLAPAVTRMAGQALAPFQGSALSATQALSKIPGLANITKGMTLAQKAALGSKLTGAAGVIGPKGLAALGTGAGLAGGLALPGLAAGAANLVSAPLRAVTGGVAQVGQQGTGMLAQGLGGYQSNYGANLPGGVPQVDQYGNVVPMGMPSDVLGLPGIGRTLESQRAGRAMAENMQRYGDVQLGFREAAARKDFERQAAMKGIAQNIATQAAMLQNAQIGAQNLGQTFGTGVANTLGQIYQYQ